MLKRWPDEDIDLPELEQKKGNLLTLTAEQAIEVGYSEGTVKNIDRIVKEYLGMRMQYVQSH